MHMVIKGFQGLQATNEPTQDMAPVIFTLGAELVTVWLPGAAKSLASLVIHMARHLNC